MCTDLKTAINAMPCCPAASQRSRGFTLIELLVVISILSVMVGLLLPAVNTIKGSAQLGTCGSNLRQAGIAISSYSNDWSGKIPAIQVDASSIWQYQLRDYFDLGPTFVFGSSSQGGQKKEMSCPSYRGFKTSGVWSTGYSYGMNAYLDGPAWNSSSRHSNQYSAVWGSWGFNSTYWSLSAVCPSATRALLIESNTWSVGSWSSYSSGHLVAPGEYLDLDVNKSFGYRHRMRYNCIFLDLHVSGDSWEKIRYSLDDPQ